MDEAAQARSVTWVGSSRRDLRRFPKPVRHDLGQALYAAQRGEVDPAAKPLKGFGDEAIYVLHAFQKKSTRGAATPQHELDLVRRRLSDAERLHRERQL